jgi:transposase-like protein
MGQGNSSTTLQQRLEIWERAQQGEPDSQIAVAMQLSPMTVRKWRRRAQHHGRNGLASRRGRPATGALSQASPELRRTLRAWRTAHPGWGPDTLRVECQTDPRFQGEPLPSRSQVAAFLKAENLVRPYERQTDLQQPLAPQSLAPHLEWEMDAQGVRQLTGVGKVSIINIGDPYSHVRTGSHACVGKSKADTADYQLALRRAFLQYGLPGGLSLDHDSAFFDNTSASPYPSQLHLWAIALGVTVRFISLGRPTEHGFIERPHQLVDHQALLGVEFAEPAAVQSALDQRVDFLNRDYPSRSLGRQTPLTAYPTASHSGRSYRPDSEADLLDLQRVYDYLAPHRWFRHVTAQGQFTLGTQRYGLGKAWANQTVEIHFDSHSHEFVCYSEDGQRLQRLTPQRLTKTALMGELHMVQFAPYPYAFPWTPEVCRFNLLHTEMTGTIL